MSNYKREASYVAAGELRLGGGRGVLREAREARDSPARGAYSSCVVGAAVGFLASTVGTAVGLSSVVGTTVGTPVGLHSVVGTAVGLSSVVGTAVGRRRGGLVELGSRGPGCRRGRRRQAGWRGLGRAADYGESCQKSKRHCEVFRRLAGLAGALLRRRIDRMDDCRGLRHGGRSSSLRVARTLARGCTALTACR